MMKRAKGSPNCRLKNERIYRRWSQQELADQIGTTLTNVSRWERGITIPGSYFRARLCSLFNKSSEELGLYPDTPDPSIPMNELVQVNSAIGHLAVASDCYIGNQELRQQLKQQICFGDINLIALSGLPGSGKTALAISLIREPDVQKRFGGNFLWASLGPNPDIHKLLSSWGELLGISIDTTKRPMSIEEWVVALHAYLNRMCVLLIIDDVWQIDDALAFKVGGPACKYLITTRFPKVAFQFADGNVIKIPDLCLEDGLQLLTYLSPNVVKKEPTEIWRLVQTVRGYPLTLTLIGKYLQHLSHYNQPRRLEQAIEYLRVDTRARLELVQPLSPLERLSSCSANHPFSVYTLIAMNEQQLDEQALAAFYALAVFPPMPGTFSEDAALAITKASAQTLDTLSDMGFVESSEPGRYFLHPTIADYAQLQLKDTEVCERLINYSVSFVERYAQCYDMLKQEQAMLHSALKHAEISGNTAGKDRILQVLQPFMQVSNDDTEADVLAALISPQVRASS